MPRVTHGPDHGPQLAGAILLDPRSRAAVRSPGHSPAMRVADRLDQMNDRQPQEFIGVVRGAILSDDVRLDAASAIDHVTDEAKVILPQTPAPRCSARCLSASD